MWGMVVLVICLVFMLAGAFLGAILGRGERTSSPGRFELLVECPWGGTALQSSFAIRENTSTVYRLDVDRVCGRGA